MLKPTHVTIEAGFILLVVYFFVSVTFARTVPFLVTIKMTDSQDSDAAMIPYNHSPDKLQLLSSMNTLEQS